MKFVSIGPSTKCSESMLSSAILEPFTASAPSLVLVTAPAFILASVTAFAFICAACTALSAIFALVTASSAIFAVVIELLVKLPALITSVGIELPVLVKIAK